MAFHTKNGDEDDFLIRAARAVPYLTPERELELSARWCGSRDRAARDELVAAHLRMTLSLAGKFRKYGLPFADMVQEGAIGLMQAADKFDLAHNVRFSTYAGWWTRSAMQEYTLKNWSIVRLPSSATQKKLFFNLRRLRARIEALQGPAATTSSVNEAIANDLGIAVSTVERAVGRLTNDASLNAPVGDDEGSLEAIDFLTDTAILPDAIAEAAIDGERLRAVLHSALEKLNERERMVIQRRKMCDDDDTETLEVLSVRFGVTRERVRQIEVNALRKLQTTLHGHRPATANALTVA